MYANSPGQQAMYNYYGSMISQQKYTHPYLSSQSNPYFCTYMPASSFQFPPVTSGSELRKTSGTVTNPRGIFDSVEFLDDNDMDIIELDTT